MAEKDGKGKQTLNFCSRLFLTEPQLVEGEGEPWRNGKAVAL